MARKVYVKGRPQVVIAVDLAEGPDQCVFHPSPAHGASPKHGRRFFVRDICVTQGESVSISGTCPEDVIVEGPIVISMSELILVSVRYTRLCSLREALEAVMAEKGWDPLVFPESMDEVLDGSFVL